MQKREPAARGLFAPTNDPWWDGARVCVVDCGYPIDNAEQSKPSRKSTPAQYVRGSPFLVMVLMLVSGHALQP